MLVAAPWRRSCVLPPKPATSLLHVFLLLFAPHLFLSCLLLVYSLFPTVLLCVCVCVCRRLSSFWMRTMHQGKILLDSATSRARVSERATLNFESTNKKCVFPDPTFVYSNHLSPSLPLSLSLSLSVSLSLSLSPSLRLPLSLPLSPSLSLSVSLSLSLSPPSVSPSLSLSRRD